jgi:hypothetical protein
MQLGPQPLPWPQGEHFSGKIADFTLTARALANDEIRALLARSIPLDVLPFEAGSKPWTVSTSGVLGLKAPQNPATLPKSQAPPSKPSAKPGSPGSGAGSAAPTPGHRRAAGVLPRPRRLPRRHCRRVHFDGWLDAVVPGRSSTFIVRHLLIQTALNNLAIPGTQQQDYRYRINSPLGDSRLRQLSLRLKASTMRRKSGSMETSGASEARSYAAF